MDIGSIVTIFVAAALLIGVGMVAMAIGVIAKRPCLRGSCGGPQALGPDGKPLGCEACPNRGRKGAAPA